MIFVTLGSQKFQFNRLLKKLDELVEQNKITDKICAQTGYSDYVPKNYQSKQFYNRDEFAKMEERADIVITHGGTGAIIGAVKKGKKVIAVARLARYGEHVDDHQIQLLEQFEDMGIIEVCHDLEDLEKSYEKACQTSYKGYESNTENIMNSIREKIEDNNKIKVLLIGNDPSVKGGITSVISQIREHDWEQEGVDMRFIPTYIEASFLKKFLFYVKAYGRIRRCIRKWHPDVAHIHMSYRGSFTRKYRVHQLCRAHGVKTVIHLHGSEFEKWYHTLKDKKQQKVRKMLREAEGFIVLGNKWNEAVKKIEPKTKTVVVSNTVKIPQEMVSWKDDPFQILFLGVLIKRKGVADLLRAMKLLVKRGKAENVHLVIAGSGQEEERLHSICKKYQLDKYVEFAGWTDGDKKLSLMKQSQMMVLPSYNEGLPMAILESMSYGLPIVSTDVGDISAAVRDGENGYLIQPGDIEGLAAAMEKVYVSKEEYERLSKNSKKIATEEFADVTYFETLAELYRRSACKKSV